MNPDDSAGPDDPDDPDSPDNSAGSDAPDDLEDHDDYEDPDNLEDHDDHEGPDARVTPATVTPPASKKSSSAPKGQMSADLDFVALRALALKPWLPFLHGNRFASVVAIKGEPGEAELAGQPPFFGPDGEALESALVALDWGSNNWCGIALDLPGKGVLSAEDLRLLIEILDPLALLALDEKALHTLQEGFGEELLLHVPKPGIKTKLLGRALVFVDGFEAALNSKDEGEAKRRVWRQLKAVKFQI